jgi:hypothetical protein
MKPQDIPGERSEMHKRPSSTSADLVCIQKDESMISVRADLNLALQHCETQANDAHQ